MGDSRQFDHPKGSLPLLALLGLLACALALRLYGMNWDQGHFFHPDERFLVQFKLPELGSLWPIDWQLFFDPENSPWNPRWFAYGSFPLYLLKLLDQLAATVVPTSPLESARFLGRGLSVVADVGTIVLVYLLGSRLYGSRTGLLAAAFTTFAVLHIQLSHFATVDVLLTFFVLLTLYGAARIVEKGDLLGGAIVGVGLGLGLATKVSMVPIVLPIGIAYLLFSFFPAGPRLSWPVLGTARLGQAGQSLVLAAGVGLALLVLTQPYALLDWGTFLRDTREQSEMVLRIRDLPFTRQYENTPPYLYHIQQLAVWGLGLPLGMVAWLGLGFALVRGWTRREKSDLLLLSWVLPYFLVTGAFPVKFLRYMLPITPLLILLGSHMLVLWWERAASRRRTLAASTGDAVSAEPGPVTSPQASGVLRFWSRFIPLLRRRLVSYVPEIVVALTLLFTVWYALAFTNIYKEDHSAVRLSGWINEHVPQGTLILKEHWEEGVPGLEKYRQGELALYEPDDTRKLDQLVQQLQEADYLIFYSNRLYGTIPRLPERYPLSTRYYQLLFSGQLGFELVRSTAAYPSFLGVTWQHDTFTRSGLPVPQGAAPALTGLVLSQGHADESFLVYDHPDSMLFQKRGALSAEELRAFLEPGLPTAMVGSSEGLMLSEGALAAQRAGGTWTHIFQRGSLANRFPLLVWLLTIEIIGLLAFPLAFWLFSAFPDRGFLLAKGLGILLVAYFSWLAASLHLLPFVRGTILLAVALLLGVGILVLLRQWDMLLRTFASRWRYLLSLEMLFLAAFLVFYVIRVLNPDLWHPWRGGEKPMDFAYLNAVVKSSFMPPYDPWYSGGYINYYYFGQFIVATIIKLTGIVPSVAYNLAVPTLFALLAANAFSVGSALVASVGRARPPSSSDVPLTQARLQATQGCSPQQDEYHGVRAPLLWAAGLTTVLLVAVIGNLDGVAQILERLRSASNVELDSTIPGLAGAVPAAAGLLQVLSSGQHLPPFDYWRSRAMGSMDPTFVDPIINAPSISITEFPFFTFLFADLHAHLIAMPFTVLAIALAVQLALRGRHQRWLGKVAFLAVFGLALGAIRWTNSWDYPTYVIVGGLGILTMELASQRGIDIRLLAKVGFQAVLLLAFSLLLFWPFQASYELFYYGGVLPSPETTPLALYLRIHGLFLLALVGFLVSEVLQRFGALAFIRVPALFWRHRYRLDRAWALYRRLSRRPDWPTALVLIALLLGVMLMASLALLGAATAGFLLLSLSVIVALALAEVFMPSHRGAGYLLVLSLAAMAIFLGLVVEVVKFDIPGEVQRMNNVFKLYLQAWVLYGVSAAYAFWWVIIRPASASEESQRSRVQRVGVFRVWMAAVALLFLGSLVYPLYATPARLEDRFGSLPSTSDGTAYMLEAVYHDEKGPMELRWDYEAFLWLQQHIEGSPVVLEAVTPIYRWGSRVSIYTGLPTVIGWDWHQAQQRWDYRDGIEMRLRDVATIFSIPDPDQAMDLLKRYDVRYVYLGSLERLYYPVAGLEKFKTMSYQGLLREVYQNPQVTIYAVTG